MLDCGIMSKEDNVSERIYQCILTPQLCFKFAYTLHFSVLLLVYTSTTVISTGNGENSILRLRWI